MPALQAVVQVMTGQGRGATEAATFSCAPLSRLIQTRSAPAHRNCKHSATGCRMTLTCTCPSSPHRAVTPGL